MTKFTITPARAAALLLPFAALAPAAHAQAVDLEHVVIAAVAEELGDVGAVVEYESLGYVELSNEDAFENAMEVCTLAGAMCSDLADGLTILCTVYSLDTCDAATLTSDLSETFEEASQFIDDGGLGAAADSLRTARAQLAELMSMENSGLPSGVQVSFEQALAALNGAADVLDVLDDDTALAAGMDYIAELRAIGADEMLIELQTPADYGWPSGFLDAEHLVTANYVGKWDETAIAANLEHTISESILASWETLGGAGGVLDTFGGAALVGQLHRFGGHLSDGMYLLRDFINASGEVGILCDYDCQSDQDCAGCTITKSGVGLENHNPEEVKKVKFVVDLVLEIDVTRRGVSAPGMADAIRDAVGDAFGDLVDKLLAKSGHLYIFVEKEKCVFSSCFIFSDESECVKKSDWVKVTLSYIQRNTAIKNWTSGMWDAAEAAAGTAASAWCAAN